MYQLDVAAENSTETKRANAEQEHTIEETCWANKPE